MRRLKNEHTITRFDRIHVLFEGYAIIRRLVSQKRHNIETQLQWKMNRNSHAICRIVSLSTRSALGRAHLPPTTVFRRLKTTNTWDFPDVIKFRVAVHTLWEKARAQKLISSSMSRHSTRNISSKFMHAFLSNLAHRHTDRQTNAGARAKTSTSSVVGGK